MSIPAASNLTSEPELSPAPQPIAISFATEWLDEDGRVCPKNVDYATQCPKGHPLVAHDGIGFPQAQHASVLMSCAACATR